MVVFGSRGALQQTSPVFDEIITSCQHRPMGYHNGGRTLLSVLSVALNNANGAPVGPTGPPPDDEEGRTRRHGGKGDDGISEPAVSIWEKSGAKDVGEPSSKNWYDTSSDEAEDEPEKLPSFQLL